MESLNLLRKAERKTIEKILSMDHVPIRGGQTIGDAWEIRYNPFVNKDDIIHPNFPHPTNQSFTSKWEHIWTNYSCAAHGWVCDEKYVVSEAEKIAAIKAALLTPHHWEIENPHTGGYYGVAKRFIKIQDGITWTANRAGRFLPAASMKQAEYAKLVVEKTANLPEGKLLVLHQELIALLPKEKREKAKLEF
jgi:hypothetical protein